MVVPQEVKMARGLTKKQRKFVNEYADTGHGTNSALAAYDTDDIDTAAVIAVENLGKPKIQEELKKLGFDSNNAKRVVGEILNDEEQQARDRLNAADKIFKVHGDYAPEKHVNVNLDADITERARRVADRLLERQRT